MGKEKKKVEVKKKKDNTFILSIVPSDCLVSPVNIIINFGSDEKKLKEKK